MTRTLYKLRHKTTGLYDSGVIGDSSKEGHVWFSIEEIHQYLEKYLDFLKDCILQQEYTNCLNCFIDLILETYTEVVETKLESTNPDWIMDYAKEKCDNNLYKMFLKNR